MRLFRVADEHGFRWNYTKTLLQTVVMWTTFLIVGPYLIHLIERALGTPTWAGWPPVGVALFVVGGSLGLRSGYVMARIGKGTPLPLDTARDLVVAGPYRWVRNPMAVAGTIQSFATGLFLGSPAVLVATVFSAGLWHVGVRPAEERDLVDRFGRPYLDYRRSVRCWVPSLPVPS
ncbi:MAG: isoprenylcysteine carboxylmethyltransferase family protein [Actinomycetota bacterium]